MVPSCVCLQHITEARLQLLVFRSVSPPDSGYQLLKNMIHLFIYLRFPMGLLHLDNIEKIDCGFWDTHVREALAVMLSLLTRAGGKLL